MPWLEYGGRLRKLPEGITVVGGAPAADLVIEQADLLPRHFYIDSSDAGLRIRPWSSEAVVAIDGQQMGSKWCEVQFGAIVSAGSTHFRVMRDSPSRPSGSIAAVGPVAHLVDLEQKLAYPLDSRTTNIGRARTNQVRLTDPTASRFHAQIRREAGGWVLHPSGSSGVQVNRDRTGTPRLLEDGDEIELAYEHFRFVAGTPPEGTRVVPRSAESDPARSERPTIARERISVVPPSARGRHPMSRPVLIGLLILFLLAALLLGKLT